MYMCMYICRNLRSQLRAEAGKSKWMIALLHLWLCPTAVEVRQAGLLGDSVMNLVLPVAQTRHRQARFEPDMDFILPAWRF